MPGRNWHIGRIAGIPIGVSPWWLAIVALITVTLGGSYFPAEVPGIAPAAAYALGLLSTLLLFAGILLHELGHALVARRHGIRVVEIDLWLLGGVSRIEGEAHAPSHELRFALAGPAVTAVILACFGGIALALPESAGATVRALIDYQVLINALILGFNLLPAFPLDGGRALRALLWRRSGDLRSATWRAARVGRGCGYVLVGLGVLALFAGSLEGLWLGLVGVFIVTVARSEEIASGVQAALGSPRWGDRAAGPIPLDRILSALEGLHAADVMSVPASTIPASITLDYASAEYFSALHHSAFPAVDGLGRVVGLATRDLVEAVPRDRRASTLVGEIVDRDPQLRVAPAADLIGVVASVGFARAGHVVVIDAAGRALGLISRSDVERAVHAVEPTSTPLPRPPVGRR